MYVLYSALCSAYLDWRDRSGTNTFSNQCFPQSHCCGVSGLPHHPELTKKIAECVKGPKCQKVRPHFSNGVGTQTCISYASA
jgi:hypothetical protein